MQHTQDCLICGSHLIYSEESKGVDCYYCRGRFSAPIYCSMGHFVCDACHSLGATDIIRTACLMTKSNDPIAIAKDLMYHPAVKLHGPEHHFLIPAVLLTTYSKAKKIPEKLPVMLEEATLRAKHDQGGFCGYYGCCGAAMGVGIFFSIVSAATPLSIGEWQIANLATAETLKEIALAGGPRCCKRNSFIALEAAIELSAKYLGINLPEISKFSCSYQSVNKECKKTDCRYFS